LGVRVWGFGCGFGFGWGADLEGLRLAMLGKLTGPIRDIVNKVLGWGLGFRLGGKSHNGLCVSEFFWIGEG
jgi:hypothetical protein